MGKRVMLEGDPPIEVMVRRSERARRLTLRVSRLDGRVTLSLPSQVAEDTAQRFLAQKADWVRRNVALGPVPYVPDLGDDIAVEGVPCRIVEGAPGLVPGEVRVRGGRPVAPQVAGLLKDLARQRLVVACDRYGGPSAPQLCAADPARHAQPLGVVHQHWQPDVLLASGHGAARSPGLCRGA